MEKYKYYKLEEQEIIETVTTIPEDMLERKGLLPYREEVEFVKVIELKENESKIEILDKEVIETITKYKLIKTLDDIKLSKKYTIKETYIIKSEEGFTCSNGIKLDCRDLDKVNWLTLKGNCKDNPELITTLKDFDNGIHPGLSCEEVLKMLKELEAHYSSLLYGKWTVEQKMFACKTIEEVNLVEWK